MGKDVSKEIADMKKLLEKQTKLANDMIKMQADDKKLKQMMDTMSKMMKSQNDAKMKIIKNMKS